MALSFLIVGLIVGMVLGITGAGGALVAIPVFIHGFGYSLKDATVLSLLAVSLGGFLNLLPVYRNVERKLGIILFLSASFGVYLSSTWKTWTPDIVIKVLIIFVSLYALWVSWTSKTRTETEIKPSGKILGVIIGFFLGILTTLTGLGGGVLIFPALKGPLGLNDLRAVATGLLVIALTSSLSLLSQWSALTLAGDEVFFLSAGTILSVILVTRILKSVSECHAQLARRLLFSVVVTLAIVTLL